jgi:iron complex outermembrane receptor protein
MKFLNIKFFLLFIMPFMAFSQIEISGKVQDKKEELPFANVVLTNPNGSIVVGAVTDEQGNFVFSAKEGLYTLTVNYIGHNEWTKHINLESKQVFNDIVLTEKENTLKEVEIVSKKKVIERKIDRIVFNVENNVSASGGDALDALKVAPGIRIQNNEIVMIGKSEMKVLIDGKIMELTGEELSNFLATISADDIKTIEIITNPPAKYVAAGNSGLVNIIFKKGRRNSWSNAINYSHVQADYGYSSLGNNFTYNKNKVKFLFNLNGRYGDYQEIEYLEVFYPDGLWKTKLDRVEKQRNLSGRLEFDYELTENTTVGFQYMRTGQKPDMRDGSVTEIYNNSQSIDSLLVTNGLTDVKVYNNSLNLHFATQIDTIGKKLTIDLDYFDYDSFQDRDFQTKSYNNSNVFLNLLTSANNKIGQDISNYSARIDMEHPMNGINLSYGGRISISDNNNKPEYYNTINGYPELNEDLTDEFEYKENTEALYISGSKDITTKWKAQLGFRYENTRTTGVSKSLNQTTKNSYGKLFPTFYLSYTMNDNNDITLNYGRRINRPNYAFLNPFRFYVNSNIYSVGNPFLQPSFTDNVELSHTYKKNLTTNLFLSITTDGFGPLSLVNEQTNEQIITRENFYNLYNYGLTETYSFNEISWLESQNTLSLSYSQSDFYNENVIAKEQNGASFYFSTFNTFLLNKSKTLKGQLNYWYSSPSKSVLFSSSECFSVDLAMRYSMMKDNLQISAGVYDIFNTGPAKQTSYINNIKQTYQMYDTNRYFRMSLSYKFGNKKINGGARDSGNEEERKRAGI